MYFEHPQILSSGAAQLIRKSTGELSLGILVPHFSSTVSKIQSRQNSYSKYRVGFTLITINFKRATASLWHKVLLIARKYEKNTLNYQE